MKKLRIAVWHNLPSGGGKRALYHHVRGLVERGHNVESWCPPTADQTYLPLSEFIEEHVVPLELKPEYFNIYAVAMGRYYDVRGKAKVMARHCEQCAKEMRQKGFDVLFANACMMFASPLIGRYVDLPKALFLQEPYRFLYEALPQFPWAAPGDSDLTWRDRRFYENAVLDYLRIRQMRLQTREEIDNAEAFDVILVNSFFSRESILRAYGLDATVCYLGVDTELFHVTGSAKEPFVVGLGSLTRGKRPDRAVRAVASIEASARPDLVWIGNFGDGPCSAETKALAHSHRVNLITKIRVTDEELVDYLNRSTAMIYTPQLEPFGFAPLEANACGTPVVALAEGGVRETIRNDVNGILVENDNPAEIGSAISALLKDPERVKRLGEAGREEVVRNWTWDSAVERLERALVELIKV